MAGEANKRGKVRRTSAASGTGKAKAKAKESLSRPAKVSPTPGIGPEGAGAGPATSGVQNSPQKPDRPIPTVNELLGEVFPIMETKVHNAIKPYVDRAKAEQPNLYSRAFAQWCAAYKRHTFGLKGGEGDETIERFGDEVFLQVIGEGYPIDAVIARCPDWWSQRLQRLGTNLEFLTRMTRALATVERNRAKGTAPKLSFPRRLVANWWWLGAWLMTETAAYNAFRHFCGNECCGDRDANGMNREVRRLELPTCAGLDVTALIFVDKQGAFTLRGGWVDN